MYIEKICGMFSKEDIEKLGTIEGELSSLDVETKTCLAKLNIIPKRALKELSKDKSGYVREMVAEREDLPEDIALSLSQDINWNIRQAILKKHYPRSKAKDEFTKVFAKDEDWRIRKAIAQHSDLSIEMLRILAEDDDVDIRVVIAQKSLPREILVGLARDPSFFVREAVAMREDLPKDILDILAEDEDEEIREIIGHRLLEE